MPKFAAVLKDAEVRALSPGVHAVGGAQGLSIQVGEATEDTHGHKVTPRSWLLRYKLHGRRRAMGLGPYPRIGLAKARELANAARELIDKGEDPIEARKRERGAKASSPQTFKEAVDAYLSAHRGKWSAKHEEQWRSSLTKFCKPIAARYVEDIQRRDVKAVLEPQWKTKTDTMARLRGRIETVLAFANAHDDPNAPRFPVAWTNPAVWTNGLDQMLPEPGKIKQVKRHAALPWVDAPQFATALREREGWAARALELVVLTAVRSQEARGARWEEFDLDRKLWVVPASRMKSRVEHVVPLSDAAVDMLKKLPRAADEVLFPSYGGKPIGPAPLTTTAKELSGSRCDVHGWRATFRTWAAEVAHADREVVETCLAHKVGNAVERAYQRGPMVERRRSLMDGWARFLAGEVADISSIEDHRRARA